MRELNVNEIQEVNGGCAEYCWGEASTEEFIAAVSSGARFGAAGAVAAALAYGFKIAWT